MMAPAGKPSIAARLLRLNLLVSGLALLLACVAFFCFDLVSYRQILVQNLRAEAQITGENSSAALLFDDRESAANNLKALRSSHDIVYAAILTPSGQVFAQYPAHAVAPQHLLLPASGAWETIQEQSERIVLAQQILVTGKTAGIVYLAANLRELESRARQYLLIAALILAVCLVAAVAATRSFRKTITKPLEELAQTARIVSRERDYSLRAPPGGDYGELNALVIAFNEMLGEIQLGNRELKSARDQMEARVLERTAELSEANRELEAFSYTVAHDLRGPLDAVNSTSFLLQTSHSAELDQEGLEMISRLRRSSQEMAALIDDLLNLSRASTVPIERGPVNLSVIAREIVAGLVLLNPSRNVEFVIAPDAVVYGNQGLLRVVLENLLRNSWKYTQKHPTARIEFGSLPRGAETVYFVRDDGAGFDPKLSSKLFQPFQRLHDKADFTGTGIGLATVHRIIARHGGQTWMEGAPEKGATAYFTLGAKK